MKAAAEIRPAIFLSLKKIALLCTVYMLLPRNRKKSYGLKRFMMLGQRRFINFECSTSQCYAIEMVRAHAAGTQYAGEFGFNIGSLSLLFSSLSFFFLPFL